MSVSYEGNAIELYKNIGYNSDPDKRKTLFKNLGSILFKKLKDDISKQNGNDNTIRILDVGIGSGEITIAFLKELFDCDCESIKGRTIEFHGVDKDEHMISSCENTLQDTFGCIEKKNDRTYSFTRNSNKLDITLYQSDFTETSSGFPENENHYDICISFFFLHHLKDKWLKDSQKISRLIKTEGILVLAEMGGDHACLSCSFDKIFDFTELGTKENENRLAFLRFIRKWFSELMKYDWFNYPLISASDIAIVLNCFIQNGYRDLEIKNFEHKYENVIKVKYFFEAAGLNNEGKKPIFSTFPGDLDTNEREDLKTSLNKFLKKLDLKANVEIELKYKLVFKALKKKCDMNFLAPRMSSLPKSTIDFFSGLLAYENEEGKKESIENFRLWRRDIEILIKHEIIKEAQLILHVSYDLAAGEDGEWRRHVPLFVRSDSDILKRVIGYSHCINHYKLHMFTDYIYREFPDKCQFVVHAEDGGTEPHIDVCLRHDGSVNKFIFKIPASENDVDYTLLNLQNDNGLPKLKIKQKRKINNQSYDIYSFNDFNTFIENHNCKNFIEAFNTKFKEAKKKYEEILKGKIVDLFNLLRKFSGNKDWVPDGQDEKIGYLVQILILQALTGINKISHFPSRDSLEMQGNNSHSWKEVSSGGLVVYYDKKTKVKEDELITLLDLRNRAHYLGQHKEKVIKETIKHSLRSSVAAIMARNKSHIHGSHIEHGLRNQMDSFEELIRNAIKSNDYIQYVIDGDD